MHYVVMDLEWNQAMSSKSSVFNKLPIHLRGEIIEITMKTWSGPHWKENFCGRTEGAV